MADHTNISDDTWAALRRHLLLGTNQQALPVALTETVAQIHIQEEEEPAFLLEAIGTVHLLQKGARRLARMDGELPAVPVEEIQTSCSWKSIQHLQAILQGHHSPALKEFAQLLKQYNKALPPTSLPGLFQQCLDDPVLWPLLQPLLGERAYWLLHQHPLWSSLAPKLAHTQAWYKAAPKEQARLLRQWRMIDATAAREQLKQHWPELDHTAKARLLPSLKAGLSLEDEDFLHQALAENRKHVRLAAADLLCLMPDSQLVKKLATIAGDVLALKGDKLQISLPENVPKDSRAYGIYPTGSKQAGGLKLNWLAQILERIPFVFWEKQWAKSATQLIPIFAASTYGLVLLHAITASLNRYPHQAAQTALIRWWLLSGQETLWNKASAKQLLATASDEQFNEILLFWFQQSAPLIPADSLPAYWLGQGKHRWSSSLSKLVVFGFRDLIQNRRTNDWSLYHYKQILLVAAYQSDAQLLDVFKNGWSFRSPGFGRWHADVEKLLQTLHFRLEMQKALTA